jgi:tetratricopeptide (TPR) repeat protein/predicted Ser/Thr protein kinase
MSLSAGTRLGPYEVLAPIGAGGMGEVYRARDTRLDRIVAVKVVKGRFSERFDREARAIASLNHPHICHLYDVGPNYLVMEFIEGTPLKGPLPKAQAITYGIEILDALGAAHTKGIVHRDLKPGNVMVTAQGVKLLDFGLAKLNRHAPSEDEETQSMELTQVGAVMGTPAYMAPEQWEGRPADARSDIYAFGCLLYEMLTGKKAGAGRLSVKPTELENVLRKCLVRDPDERWQSAAEVRVKLLRAHGSRTWRYAAIAAAVVLTLAAVGIGFRKLAAGRPGQPRPVDQTAVRPAPATSQPPGESATASSARQVSTPAATGPSADPIGRSSPLTDKDMLVLADLANLTGDPVFDGILREALAAELEQSPLLKVIANDQVREDLQLMGRSSDERLTNQIAREICQRESEKAMIGGSIASLGKTYAIALQASNCATGETIARERAEAQDKEHVLQALSMAAKGMRAKLGESLSSIQKLERFPGTVTTKSLEAFQYYSQGMRKFAQGEYLEAVPSFQRATEVDPNFATAWRVLGLTYFAMGGERSRQTEYFTKAYRLADRVSEGERLAITSYYYLVVTGERDKAADSFELWARTYPRDAEAFNLLRSIYTSDGKWEKALEEARMAMQLAPRVAAMHSSLAYMNFLLDRFEEAKRGAAEAFSRKLDPPRLHELLLDIAYIQDDRSAAENEIQWFVGKPEEYTSLKVQAAYADTFGQRRRSRDLLRQGALLAQGRGLSANATQLRAQADAPDILFRNCDPVREIGSVAGLCSDPSQALSRLEESAKQNPNDARLNAVQLPVIRAIVELRRGQPAQAIELLRSAGPYERTNPRVVYLRGLAYLSAKRGAEAAGEFQKILSQKGANADSDYYPLSYIGVARGEMLAGDKAKARSAYQRFLDLWEDADPDVPVLIEARKDYAALQ